LSQAEAQVESGQKQIRTAVTNMLQLHLAYIGKRITCRTARPFLPSMLDAALEIKVPTPITVHLDNCLQCREDLEVIRELHLDRNQLWQLRRILTGQTCDDSLADPARMQQLQKNAGRITERPESGVVTVYTIDESATIKLPGESDDVYAGFPIRVEVTDSEEAASEKPSEPTIDLVTALRRKVSAMNFGPLVKPAVVASGVLLITAALFFSTLTAKAVTIEQVYKAIEKVKNVYIAKFAPDKTEPKQELWVSKTLNIYLTRTKNESVLWDISNGLKTKKPDTGAIETTTLTGETLAGIEGKVGSYLGLVPFTNISYIPADAEWNRVTDQVMETTGEGIEVYDLTWVKKVYDGSVIFKKWRVFIDPNTNLPWRTEFYRKLAEENEYTLESMNVIEYLGESEMHIVLKEASF